MSGWPCALVTGIASIWSVNRAARAAIFASTSSRCAKRELSQPMNPPLLAASPPPPNHPPPPPDDPPISNYNSNNTIQIQHTQCHKMYWTVAYYMENKARRQIASLLYHSIPIISRHEIDWSVVCQNKLTRMTTSVGKKACRKMYYSNFIFSLIASHFKVRQVKKVYFTAISSWTAFFMRSNKAESFLQHSFILPKRTACAASRLATSLRSEVSWSFNKTMASSLASRSAPTSL